MGGRTRKDGGFYAGITGHRPDRLDDAVLPGLDTRIRSVLDALLGPLTVVSSLAEGADRLAAAAATARGDRLLAILPFAKAEFARDFATEGSLAEFAGLLAQASEIIELPGTRGAVATDAAYEAAAAAVLARADVLLAIWDGEPGRGIGGTAHTVEVALARDIPVIWIAARPPHEVRILPAPGGADPAGPDLRNLEILLESGSVS